LTQIEKTGLPRPAIFYQLDRYIERALANAKIIHEDMFARVGVEAFWHKDDAQAAGHIMGTARMGDDPATSVVDRWNRSHDVPNLYIADGSTFVTSGGVNPTSTIVSLALRAADRMVETRFNQQVPL
jgi:choline dehydrogenase-like flavoprotein